VLAWAFYDFANSSYYLIMLSFVFPIYFKEVVVGGSKGDFYWGLVLAVSILLGGLAAPIIGAIADYDNRKKPKFILFTLICIASTAILYFSGPGKVLFSSIFFIIASFSLALILPIYDSFLGWVSKKENAGTVSGFAWGLGYMGGLAAVVLFKPFYGGGYAGSLDYLYRLTFPLTAVFFLVFSLPAFLYIVEFKRESRKESFYNLIKIGFKKTFTTLKNIREHSDVAWFLLGFYLFSDALGTLFAFMPIYARGTLKLSFLEITALLLVIQIIAFPASALAGFISDKMGSRRILITTLWVWAIIVGMLAMAGSKSFFYLIAFLIALVIGSSQTIARSWLSKMVPPEKRFEFFGFNSFASKIAATTGPVIFGTVSVLTNNQRWAVLSLLPFFVLSIIIFSRIKEG